MAILRGFPPSNTISPTTYIGPKDLPYPAKPEVGAKNHWVRQYKLRKEKEGQFTMKCRVIKPSAKLLAEMQAASEAAGGEKTDYPRVKGFEPTDKCKVARFMSSEV